MIIIQAFKEHCEQQAAHEVRGSRNAREYAVKIARDTAPKRYRRRMKTATTILRSVGMNLGNYKFQDVRYVLDVVTIAKVTDKMVIGTCGERVPIEKVILWGV